MKQFLLLITPNNFNGKTLTEGRHLIEYKLNGKVNYASYLMFYFIDINNKVQSVPLLNPIDN